MLPLVIVAFAGIGVTRLALLALELHVRTYIHRCMYTYAHGVLWCGDLAGQQLSA